MVTSSSVPVTMEEPPVTDADRKSKPVWLEHGITTPGRFPGGVQAEPIGLDGLVGLAASSTFSPRLPVCRRPSVGFKLMLRSTCR